MNSFNNEPTRLMYGPGAYIVNHGCYRGVKWFINKNNLTPCAYVVIDEPLNSDVKVEKLMSPHGGITYDTKGLYLTVMGEGRKELVPTTTRVIGWDYGHALDYMEHNGLVISGKCWSKYEVEEHVKNTIDELIELCK